MRRTKVSVKKYFYFTLICALLLIFVFNLRDREIWKSKNLQTSTSLQLQSHTNTNKPSDDLNDNDDLLDGDGDDDADDDDDDDADDDADADAVADAEDNANYKNKVNAISHKANNGEQHELASFSTELKNIIKNTSKLHDVINTDEEFADSQQQHHHNQHSSHTEEPFARAWFFKNGDYYPTPMPHRKKRKGKKKYGAKLFPHQDPYSDRIANQLMFVPYNYEQIRESGKLKTILLFNGLGPWNIKQGRDVFLRSKCPVDTCELTPNRERASTADMILYKDHYIPTGIRRAANSKQVTMLYHLESPYHTQNIKVPDAINWTSTYRRDSDVMAPYEKWQYYNTNIRQLEQDRNFALNKTKKVAWFVSNCGARNGRLQFAHELQKHIEVDIYGACGNLKCPRSTADKCFEILDHDYKFYLAFENSNCKDYITEKLFVNSLSRNILPIVMGARPEDYELSSPYRSYIHVDEFSSPKELAEYLNILDRNDDLYNSYFKWKGTGEFINTFYWCRVCAVLHDEDSLRKSRWYPNFNEWWRGPGVCTSSSWRNFKARKDVITDD